MPIHMHRLSLTQMKNNNSDNNNENYNNDDDDGVGDEGGNE